MIEVSPFAVKLVAATEPNMTELAPVKPTPVIVTEVPPAVDPDVGLTDMTMGTGVVVVVVVALVVVVVPPVVVVVAPVVGVVAPVVGGVVPVVGGVVPVVGGVPVGPLDVTIVPSSPTAKHALGPGHEIPFRALVVPESCAVHVDPPSVVPRMVPPPPAT